MDARITLTLIFIGMALLGVWYVGYSDAAQGYDEPIASDWWFLIPGLCFLGFGFMWGIVTALGLA